LAFLDSFLVVWKEKPDFILTNGPGTSIPICFSAFLIRFITQRYISVVFIESFACVDHLSVTGLLLYFSSQTDLFFCSMEFKSDNSQIPESYLLWKNSFVGTKRKSNQNRRN